MKDFLESREFYELSQAYRHSFTGLPEWEILKGYIRQQIKESGNDPLDNHKTGVQNSVRL